MKTNNGIVQGYIIHHRAPGNDTNDEVKDGFYDSLNHLLSSIGASDLIILMGFLFNVKFVGHNEGYEALGT